MPTRLVCVSRPPLPEGIGWVICVALGCFFAALVSAMVYVVSSCVAQRCKRNQSSLDGWDHGVHFVQTLSPDTSRHILT